MEMNQVSNVPVGEEVLPIVHLSVDLNAIPRYFDNRRLCENDIIAYVRSQDRYPNPKQIVILDTDDSPVDADRLKDVRIFYGGPRGNDKEASQFSGTADIVVPVFVEQFDTDVESLGLDEICSQIATEYGVDDFGILLCGTKKDQELLSKAWQYMQFSGTYGCVVPDFVLAEAARDTKAIDIAPTVERLRYLEMKNELNHKNLMQEVNKIGAEIEARQKTGEDVTIVCSLNIHTILTRQLLLYLSLKYSISPKYIESYVHSYVDGNIIYDHSRMSLYERFMWVRNLPDAFGYLGHTLSFRCFCSLVDDGLFLGDGSSTGMELALTEKLGRKVSKESAARIYPVPLYAIYVNRETHSNIVFRPEDGTGDAEVDARLSTLLSMFELVNYGDVIPLVDFRTMFKGSAEYFTEEPSFSENTAKLATMNTPGAMDAETDRYWCAIFIEMARKVKERYNDDIAPTVKNSVLCPVSNSELLLLYCPGSLGLTCMLKSAFFNKDVQTIGEENFNRFVDIRTLLALIDKEQAMENSTAEESKMRFDAIMKRDQKNIQPWIDIEVMLALNVLRPRNTGLSYYDRMLRSTKNVLPIITDKDDPLYEESPLLEEFSFLDLMNVDQSNSPLSTLTCFGTLADDVRDVPVLQTTLESYRGCKLL